MKMILLRARCLEMAGQLPLPTSRLLTVLLSGLLIVLFYEGIARASAGPSFSSWGRR